jgi:2-dehydropantoate 2-reductase
LRYTIYGAGAIGGMLGAYLIRAGHDVTLVDSDPEYAMALRHRGLRVTNGIDVRVAPRVVLSSELDGPLSTVLLAVKGQETEDAVRAIAPLLADDGYVVSFQNGLETLRVAAVTGPARALAACFTFGGFVRSPGQIVFTGPGACYLGEVTGSVSPRAELLATALSGFHPVDLTANVLGHLWAKLAVAAMWAAASLSDADVDAVLADSRYRPALGGIAGEVAAIATADGTRCEEADGFDPKTFAAEVVDPEAADASWHAQLSFWRDRSDKRTGIWRDLTVRHRSTEVGPMYGPVLERASRHGIAAPRLRWLVGQYRAAEAGELALGWENLDLFAAVHADSGERRA